MRVRVRVLRVRVRVRVSFRALPAAAVLVRSSSSPLAPEIWGIYRRAIGEI